MAGGMEDMGMGGPGDLDFTEGTDTGTGGHVSTRVHCTTYIVSETLFGERGYSGGLTWFSIKARSVLRGVGGGYPSSTVCGGPFWVATWKYAHHEVGGGSGRSVLPWEPGS